MAVLFGCGGGGGGSQPQTPIQNTTPSGTTAVNFWAVNFTSSENSYYQTTATKVAEGLHCYVYLEQGQNVSQAEIDAVVNQFDTKVYPGDTTAFGSEPNPGIDGDPKIYILLLNVRDGYNFKTNPAYVAGYFDSSNEYGLNQFAFSNQKELLYMNINPATGVVPASTDFNTTMAHEFQHLIHWEQKTHRLNIAGDETWLDEGMATVAGDFCGYGPDYGLVATFEHAASHSLTVWEDGSAANYGVVYMWAQYIKDQFGQNNIFYSMLHNNQTGTAEVNTALTAIGSSKDFTAIFRDWAIALYTGNGTTVAKPAGHPEWAYTSIDTWPGTHNGVPLPGLFPASRQNNTTLAALAAWGLGFYSYTPASGTTGMVKWTPAGTNDKAHFIDAGSGSVTDMVAGTTYSFTTEGYLVAENPAGSASGIPTVTHTAIETAGGSTAVGTAETQVSGQVKSARQLLAAMNNDPVVRAQVAATGKPVRVCIDASLREREKALRAQGIRPPF